MTTAEYNYTALFEPAEEGGYTVTVPALPGCITGGDTFEEAQAMAQEAILGYIESLRAQGRPIPDDVSIKPEPGKEPIRISVVGFRGIPKE